MKIKGILNICLLLGGFPVAFSYSQATNVNERHIVSDDPLLLQNGSETVGCRKILLAKEKSITGQVIDDKGPIPFATISLYSATDSTYLTGGVSNEKGEFDILLPNGEIIVKISCIGYKSFWRHVDRSNFGVIHLSPESTTLNEVVVKAHRRLITSNNGQLTLNIAASSLKNIGKAIDLFKYIPGVVAINGKYEVFGKGEPDIYIDKRKIHSKSELSLLNSADIKSISLITNPGAEYDADTRSVVLISTFRNHDNGLSSIINVEMSKHKNWSNSEDVNFNLHHNKLDFFLSYRNDRTRSDIKYDINQTDNESDIYNEISASAYSDRTLSHDYSVGLNYDISKVSSIGFKYMGTTSNYKLLDSPYDYVQMYKNGNLISCTDNKTNENEKELFHNINLYYTGKLSQRMQLQLDADYVYSRLNHAQAITEASRLSEVIDTTHMHNIYKNRVMAMKGVLTFEMASGHRLNFGTDFSETTSWGTSDNLEGKIANDQYSDRETKYAGFFTYDFACHNWSGNIGLRYEYVKARNKDDGEMKYKENYSDLLPSLGLSTFWGKWNVGINFSSRINRPSFRQLNNSVSYNNQYHYEQGNIYLKPQYVYDTELNLSYRILNIKMNYQYIEDYIHPTAVSIEGKSGTVAWTSDNAKEFQQLGMMCVLSPVFGCWRPVLTTGIYKPIFTLPFNGMQIKYNHPYGIVSFQNAVELKRDWLFRGDLFWNIKGHHGIYEQKSYGSFNLMAQKSFFSKRLIITLKGEDLLNWSRLKDIKKVNFVIQNRAVDNYTRSFILTVRYNLNSFKNKYHGNGSAENEINRF